MFRIDVTNAFVIELSFITTKSCCKPKTDARGNYVEKIVFLHICINSYFYNYYYCILYHNNNKQLELKLIRFY